MILGLRICSWELAIIVLGLKDNGNDNDPTVGGVGGVGGVGWV